MKQKELDLLCVLFGLFSIILNILFIGSFIFAIIAIYFYMQKSKKTLEMKIGFWMAIAGIILGSIGILFLLVLDNSILSYLKEVIEFKRN